MASSSSPPPPPPPPEATFTSPPPPPPPEAAVSAGAEENNREVHKTKSIHFLGRTTPILLQNDNGPCALLAICNVLLLKNQLKGSSDILEISQISQDRLLQLVAEKLLDSNSNISNKDAGYAENQWQNISDAIALLPRLATGIDVNMKFTRIDDFEFTRECAIFDLLDIPLYHGWIVDPQDHNTAIAIASKSYNTLVEELVSLDARDTEPVSVDKSEEESVDFAAATTAALGVPSPCFSRGIILSDTIVNGKKEELTPEEGALIRNFLKINASQLTIYGLFRLRNDLKERELCVFFRNNHFNTMFKFEGDLYILATDQGFMNQPGLVWEKLNEVNGNTMYMTYDFKEFNGEDHNNTAWDEQIARASTAGASAKSNNTCGPPTETFRHRRSPFLLYRSSSMPPSMPNARASFNAGTTSSSFWEKHINRRFSMSGVDSSSRFRRRFQSDQTTTTGVNDGLKQVLDIHAEKVIVHAQTLTVHAKNVLVQAPTVTIQANKVNLITNLGISVGLPIGAAILLVGGGAIVVLKQESGLIREALVLESSLARSLLSRALAEAACVLHQWADAGFPPLASLIDLF